MLIRKKKIIIILQPVDGATDGATRRVICPASYNNERGAMRFLCSMLGLLVTIARFVLAVARSKFRQRQYFLTQFTDMLFCYCYKCFFNILILYIVCE